MSKRLDLPVKDIVRLRDDLELTFKEIKDALSLDCHVNTVRRHYYRAKEEAESKVMMNELNAKEDGDHIVADYLPENIIFDEFAILDEFAAEEEIKSAWQRFVDWLRGIFRK